MALISVLMSVYNEPLEWLEKAVDSILSQTVQDFEFIIVIDNPDLADDRLSFLQSVSTSDKRIILLKNSENLGLARSLNIALNKASGEYIARMDADDISFSERFKVELDYFNLHKTDMVSSLRVNIDENGRILGQSLPKKGSPEKLLPIANYIVHPSVMIKTSCITDLGGYRNFASSQDYDLWLRMLTKGYSITVLNEPLIYYRIRSNSVTSRKKMTQYYTSVYQKKLYYERRKKGTDSYSEENLEKYLKGKRITESRNTRFFTAKNRMDTAIDEFRRKDLRWLKDAISAFLLYPEVPIQSAIEIFKSRV